MFEERGRRVKECVCVCVSIEGDGEGRKGKRVLLDIEEGEEEDTERDA